MSSSISKQLEEQQKMFEKLGAEITRKPNKELIKFVGKTKERISGVENNMNESSANKKRKIDSNNANSTKKF